MTRQRCHLTRHAMDDSIPLRVGRCLTADKVFLEDCEEDDEGTNGQRPAERERGNRHVVAELWPADETNGSLGRWRIVLGKPREKWHDPPVVTVLPVDPSTIKTEGTLTEVLKRERESGKHDWLTPRYIAEVLHDLYRRGQLSRVEQLTEHIRERDKAPLVEEHEKAVRRSTALQAENAELQGTLRERDAVIEEKDAELKQLRVALASLPQSAPPPRGDQERSLVPEPGKQVTDVWSSRKPNSPYRNVGLEATVVRVDPLGHRIRLTFIDRDGNPHQVEDFGYQGFIEPVYDYLKSREGQRAVFILTWKDDKVLRLASDTMMLPSYADLWN